MCPYPCLYPHLLAEPRTVWWGSAASDGVRLAMGTACGSKAQRSRTSGHTGVESALGRPMLDMPRGVLVMSRQLA